jgi:hypothetical protein
MTISCTASRFGQGRVCAQRWAALAAVLVLTVCCPQQGAVGATIQVNTTQQGVTAGQCSLQEAIYASEFKSSTAISSTNPDVTYNTGCTAGTGDDDIIVLTPGALDAFDHFWDGDGHNIFGPTATPIIVSKITIEGNGATLQLFESFRPVNSRLFAIGTVNDPDFPSGTGDLTLRNVYIKNFHVKGGDGANGGGGGLGAGGAIYNEGSLLTIENSTFESNGAVGGNGSGSGGGLGGGGGGLSGRGGSGCVWSAGGGGGSRGNGGNGSVSPCFAAGGGGGGGGTISAGGDGEGLSFGGGGGSGASRCGGDGGTAILTFRHSGHNATCAGGGGGGAGGNPNQLCGFVGSCYPQGGHGWFGGGGGGGIGQFRNARRTRRRISR